MSCYELKFAGQEKSNFSKVILVNQKSRTKPIFDQNLAEFDPSWIMSYVLKMFQVYKQQQILIKDIFMNVERSWNAKMPNIPNVRQTLVVTFDGRKFTSIQNVIKT